MEKKKVKLSFLQKTWYYIRRTLYILQKNTIKCDKSLKLQGTKLLFSPGSCCSVDWALACTRKGRLLDFHQGTCLGGESGPQKGAHKRQPHIDVSLSPSIPHCLKNLLFRNWLYFYTPMTSYQKEKHKKIIQSTIIYFLKT